MHVCDQYGIFFGGRWKFYRTAELISPVFRHIPMERRMCFIFSCICVIFLCIVHP